MTDNNPESEWTAEPQPESEKQPDRQDTFSLPEEPLLDDQERITSQAPPLPDSQPAPLVEEKSAQTSGQMVKEPSAPASRESQAPTSEERTWATIAQLSVLLNLVTGFLGPLVALIIYLVYKDRSRYVAYQSLQAFLFQLLWWGAAGLLAGFMGFITFLLVITVVGICLVPITGLLTIIFGLLPVASLFYGVFAAVETNQGRDFRYWLIGDWVRRTYTG